MEIKPGRLHQQGKRLGLSVSAPAQRACSNSTPTSGLLFPWILSRPAEQQLNLQTALNYSAGCGTTENTSARVTWS